MPRRARIVIPGVFHHVCQRGNDRQDVFLNDDDSLAYLSLLKLNCGKYGVRVYGYCLMSNHVHLVVVPLRKESLGEAMGRTHWHYSQGFNEAHGHSGHLWQNRFYSCPLDRPHFYRTLRYVERNPVRAGLIDWAWRYRWSSAAAHVGDHRDDLGLLRLDNWDALRADLNWRQVLIGPTDEEELALLRLHLSTGRPLGSDQFIAKLEAYLGRRLRASRGGRPRKRVPEET